MMVQVLQTAILKKMLKKLKETSIVHIHYYENDKNIGIGPTLHRCITLSR